MWLHDSVCMCVCNNVCVHLFESITVVDFKMLTIQPVEMHSLNKTAGDVGYETTEVE